MYHFLKMIPGRASIRTQPGSRAHIVSYTNPLDGKRTLSSGKSKFMAVRKLLPGPWAGILVTAVGEYSYTLCLLCTLSTIKECLSVFMGCINIYGDWFHLSFYLYFENMLYYNTVWNDSVVWKNLKAYF